MVNWADFAEAAPEMAAEGRRLMHRTGEAALLATVRGAAPPRIHPINVGVVLSGLYAFLLESAKRRDLELDGRFAQRAHQDPAEPSEFMLRGCARAVEADAIRAAAAEQWYFTVGHAYVLYEFAIESALLGTRPTADSWPPAYLSWTASGAD